MKISDQTKVMVSGFENSTHTFFSRIAKAIQEKISQETGMEVQFIGKSASGKGSMKAALVGQFKDPDEKKVEQVGEKIGRIMSELKNPANLMELLK